MKRYNPPLTFGVREEGANGGGCHPKSMERK
jgi:hypothetical protein